MLGGTSWPLSFDSSGLGSKVSTCDGPPPMNSRMTLFALPLSVAGSRVPSSAARRPSSASKVVRARPPKPSPARRSRSRRPMGVIRSLHVDDLVDVQQRLTEQPQARSVRRAEEAFRRGPLLGVGAASEGQAEGQLDLGGAVVAGDGLDALGERFRPATGEVAV